MSVQEKYVTTISKGRRQSEEEDGALVAVKDAAFDWFVTAIFHIIPAENGAVRLTKPIFDQPIQISKDEKTLFCTDWRGKQHF